MNLKGNFTVVPEGERVLEITKAECKPSGKPTNMKVTFKDIEGGFINSQYNFDNDKSLFAMGKLLETALEFEDKKLNSIIGVNSHMLFKACGYFSFVCSVHFT